MDEKAKAALEKLRAGLRPSPAKSTAPAGGPVAKTVAPNQYRSQDVRRPERAGRAPYNFVPLTGGGWREWRKEPPELDHFELNSGEIDLQITAETDFYIRGMQPLDKYDPEKPAEESFQVNGKLRLPGSSLRGMIRNLVEILGCAPLHPVNDDQLFFRSVAAVPDPSNWKSFEPQAVAYKDRIGGPAGLKVKPGYLYANRDLDRWYIMPAVQSDLYRMDGDDRYWKREAVRFTVARPPMVELGSGQPGCAIYSGPIQKKRRQWAIAEEDKKGNKIGIPKGDVAAYLDGGQVDVQELGPETKGWSYRDKQRERSRVEQEFRYSADDKNPKPCFYVKWTFDGKEHVSFGHTPHFRLPYQRSTAKAIPPEWRREETDTRWDIAQAIFGRAPVKPKADQKSDPKTGRRTRVFFEDAILVKGEQDQRSTSVTLGTPKPTTYQHYLVQRSDDLRDIIHWDGDYKASPDVTPVVRGHKIYWHRPGVPVRETAKTNVQSTFRKGLKGCEFRARIRYENLDDVELGLLLTALDLPEGCAHRLGMGKPLGLGSFRIRITEAGEISRQQRYATFASNQPDGTAELATGKSNATVQRLIALKQAFAEWYKSAGATLWDDPRLVELKALLTVDGLPEGWEDRTRYLEFGGVFDAAQGKKVSYNEYLAVGYPKRIENQKRRPLPPATQVLKGGDAIPSDKRPDFK